MPQQKTKNKMQRKDQERYHNEGRNTGRNCRKGALAREREMQRPGCCLTHTDVKLAKEKEYDDSAEKFNMKENISSLNCSDLNIFLIPLNLIYAALFHTANLMFISYFMSLITHS